MRDRKSGVLFHAFDRNPSNPGLTSWFMDLHGLVPISLRGKIPEFLPGWKAIFNAVKRPTGPTLGDAPAGLTVFSRHGLGGSAGGGAG